MCKSSGSNMLASRADMMCLVDLGVQYWGPRIRDTSSLDCLVLICRNAQVILYREDHKTQRQELLSYRMHEYISGSDLGAMPLKFSHPHLLSDEDRHWIPLPNLYSASQSCLSFASSSVSARLDHWDEDQIVSQKD
jgi:hypothetical protein